MARDSVGWELYRSFLGVLKEGSLSGAARLLGIAQPTVGRHIAALERALRLRLFLRTQTGLLPTDAALALRTYAEGMESTAAALERTAASQGEGIQGTVRITASDVISVEVLPAIVATLHAAHPLVKIELAVSNRVQDLLRREADIAVRMVRPQQASLVARRIGNIELGLHATREYVEKHGVPKSLDDIGRHVVIGFDQVTPFVRSAAPGLVRYRDAFSVRTDSDVATMALIRCGVGIGVCQVPLARRYGLVRVMPKALALPLETWVTMHEDLRASPRCRVTFDALVQGLQSYLKS